MLFLLLLILLLVVLADAICDYFLITSGTMINHFQSTLFPIALGATLAAPLVLVHWYEIDRYYVDFISIVIIAPFVRWQFHDMLLNKWRGLPSDYLGEGPHSARTDRFLIKFRTNGFHPEVIRVIFLAISLLAFYIIQLVNYEMA